MAASLSRVATGELSHKINLLKEQKAQRGTLVTGRQILLMVHEHYRISATDGALLDFQDLLEVKLQNDDLRSFLQDWETVLTQMKDVPEDQILEALFRKQVEQSVTLRDQMSYYNRLDIGHPDKSYAFLVSAVRKLLERLGTSCKAPRIHARRFLFRFI